MKRRNVLKTIFWSGIVINFQLPLWAKQSKIMKMNQEKYDVIIIGGSYAGLSAAMALGRSTRNVLIIDGGKPCNRFTPHSHNFITHDGAEPAAISQKAKEEVLEYNTVEWVNGMVNKVARVDNGFKISLSDNQSFLSQKIILATGIKDVLMEQPGFKEAWGNSIIHCPYCHGYEFKEQRTGIIANGDKAMHLAGMVNNLTKHLTILTNGIPQFNDDDLKKLADHQIDVVDKEISAFKQTNGKLEAVVFSDKTERLFEATYAALPFEQASVIKSTGCDLDEAGFIKVDEWNRTSVEGIYAAGDNCTFMRSVANAVAAGNRVGAVVNMELIHENF